MTSKHTRPSPYWIIATTIAVVAILAGLLLWRPWAIKNIHDFETCKNAGGALLESYPEQCIINGKSYTNSTQSVKTDANTYIGLTEQAALDQAKSQHTPARIVERDDDALAITMDYAPGRLNLYIKDGKVYKVQIEGNEH